MTRPRTIIILLLALVLSNAAWAIVYRSLWYDAAQAEGLLDDAESYIHGGQR